MRRIVVISGYFNPMHIGHVSYMKAAKNLGDILIVIVNNDNQVKIKGSIPFMPEKERIEIVKAIRYVDEVFLSKDKDRSVCESLKVIAKKYKKDKLFFANGGDRHANNIPEAEVCKKFNIKMVDGVGGGKVQSSSWLLSRVSNQ